MLSFAWSSCLSKIVLNKGLFFCCSLPTGESEVCLEDSFSVRLSLTQIFCFTGELLCFSIDCLFVDA